MKYLTIPFVLLITLTGCKKDNDPTPDTASRIGDYSLTSVVLFKVGTQIVTENAKGTLSIKAGKDANTLTFTEKLPAYESTYSVTVSGNDFKIEPISDKIVVDGKAYTAPSVGFGNFQTYGLKISKSVATAETGQSQNRVLEKSVEMTAFK